MTTTYLHAGDDGPVKRSLLDRARRVPRAVGHRLTGRLAVRREASTDLGPVAVIGHVLVDSDGALWAHYELAGQRWSFLSTDARRRLMVQGAIRWAALAPRAVKLRSTSRPYPAAKWAADLHASSRSPLPDVPDAVGFEELLARWDAGDRSAALSWEGWLLGQQHRLRATRMGERLVTVGVRLVPSRGSLSIEELAAAVTWSQATLPEGQQGRIVSDLRKVTQVAAGPGWGAKPASTNTVERLMHTALAPGLPSPLGDRPDGDQMIDETDLRAITDRVQWRWEPFARTVEVTALRGSSTFTRHVAVLTCGRQPDLRFPGAGAPWLTLTDQLAFPVEWSLSGHVLTGRTLEESVDWDRRRVEGLRKDYSEFGETPPRSIAREIDHAQEILDEITEGSPEVAARFRGVCRGLVSAPTPEEAIERAHEVADFLMDRARIPLHLSPGQVTALAEFFPAAKWESRGYERIMPVRYLAAGVPHTASQIGDGAGPYVGKTSGATPSAFMLDGHRITEGKKTRSGLCPVVADQGAGKSMLTGILAYQGVRTGKQVVVLDPSGPLARLCEVPELAPWAQHISLTSGDPGSLSPPALIADSPPTGNALEDAKLRKLDSQDRAGLLVEALSALVPPGGPRADAARLLPRAMRALVEPAEEGGRRRLITRETSPWEVIDLLPVVGGDAGGDLAAILADVAELAQGALILGERGEIAHPADFTRRLTVLSVDGVEPPPTDVPEETWTTPQRLVAPLLNMAVLVATRMIRQGDEHVRRQIHLDELHFFTRWASGQSFFRRVAVDSRKRNVALYVSTQLPGHLMPFGDQTLGLFAHSFVGRVEDEDVARKALELVRVDAEYADVVTGLSQDGPGEFLYRDGEGRVERIRVDAEWLPHLFERLRTDPGRQVVRGPDAGPDQEDAA